jgi:hypothetical protein
LRNKINFENNPKMPRYNEASEPNVFPFGGLTIRGELFQSTLKTEA